MFILGGAYSLARPDIPLVTLKNMGLLSFFIQAK
jgi:hypothetical protein